ncbi:hypothetical protein CYMTET_49013 [Cymbomonas tetramitiformis]|uniref:Uncharacterized protein n=1 Tax=Cymbomonas tetramitiformis TaxID=36881 RepID=A0AAE0EV60_9CHLO|nr:hypothetical protein CYMTET_49013 [Cymbomonas tetramitiformis]
MGTSMRSHTAAARRSLVTIFDDAATRHATTPATPTVAAAPAAQSAGAVFLDEVRRLAKESFDERAAKLVIKNVYDDKHGRFHGTESHVSSVFARLVLALRDIFVTEEDAFSSLFDLEDATLPVRAEANKLLFSTLEYIIAPVSPAADWMESSAEANPFDGKRVLLEIARIAGIDATTRVGDGMAVLNSRSVSSQVTTTRPFPSVTRARDTAQQAPPVRTAVHYVHAPPIAPSYMGSGLSRDFEECLSCEEEDESEYPVGYFDESDDSCEEVEEEQDGHLAAPHFLSDRLEQDYSLDTGFQGGSYGGVLEPPLGEEFLPQSEFHVGTVSFIDEPAMSDEDVYTAEEWAAWEAGAHDSDDTGGAGFYDEETYFDEGAAGPHCLFSCFRQECFWIPADPFRAPQTFWPSRSPSSTYPSRTIAAFNAALRSARRKSTLDDMEVKSLFIKSLDPVFYAPVVNRLLLHDQRAAESLATIQQWTRECYAQNGTDSHVPPAARTFSALTLTGQSDDEDFKTIFSELRDQLFDMKKEIKALHNRIDDTKGFTTRNDKKNAIGRGGHGDGVRFAAKPLPERGNFPQSLRGRSLLGRRLSTNPPNAMDNNDAARFDAVCYIADGKPELYDTVSAFSFAVAEEQVPDTIDEYLECRQPADTRFGVCAVGGAVNINTFKVHDEIHAGALVVPPPPAPPSAPQSVVSDEEMYPISALHAHETHMSFMDKFAVNLDLTGPEPTLAMHSMGTVAPVDSVSVAADDSEDDDECLPPPRRALGCGRPPMGFGFSALTSLAVCLLFVVCATAMPSRGRSTQASSATPEHTGDEVARWCWCADAHSRPAGALLAPGGMVPQRSWRLPRHPLDVVPGSLAAARSGSDCYRAALAGWCSAIAGLRATRLGRGDRGWNFFFTPAPDPTGCTRCN